MGNNLKDLHCIEFLENILPRLSLRWYGYRKVHGQVCKRIRRRIQELHLADLASYHSYLKKHPAEWSILKDLCRITISRFYRDRVVFQILEKQILPLLAETSEKRGEKALRCWSAGCASGEEPYTLALLWDLRLKPQYPQINFQVIATDVAPECLKRAEEACYPFSSIRELPEDIKTQGFCLRAGGYHLQPTFRTYISFLREDIQDSHPNSHYDLILCRNLVFTYFEEDFQAKILSHLAERLAPGGFLVIGAHEKLPPGTGLKEVANCFYQKCSLRN